MPASSSGRGLGGLTVGASHRRLLRLVSIIAASTVRDGGRPGTYIETRCRQVSAMDERNQRRRTTETTETYGRNQGNVSPFIIRHAPSPDPLLSLRFYERTSEEQAALGFLAEPTKEPGESSHDASTVEANSGGQRMPHGSVGAVAGRRAIAQGNSDEISAALCRYSAPEEVDTLPSSCSACTAQCVTRFFSTKIPYFREVILMATTCDVCGYRNSELKPGGGIPAKGKKTTLHVQEFKDLSRDVIKSDSAAVYVPELELELSAGTLGGMVTTVEGLIVKICEALERVHGFQLGDSTHEWEKKKWDDFQEKLAKLLNLEEPWTLIIDDALAASFIAPATDLIEEDKQLTIEEYERSLEQNDELGLNHMDTSSADMAYNTTST